MSKIDTVKSRAIPMPIEHVDTDQIIPARFLKATTREGFGKNLFRDWRYDKNDQAIRDFVLNNPDYSGSILICGNNFGCGSSREHAAWALHDYGIRAVVSSFFADIFKGNALNNGVLPIQLKPNEMEQIFRTVETDHTSEFLISLEAQTFEIVSSGEKYSFDIDPYKKHCLLNGFDDLDFLMSLQSKIEEFEKDQIIF